jgi:hypothetical protein
MEITSNLGNVFKTNNVRVAKEKIQEGYHLLDARVEKESQVEQRDTVNIGWLSVKKEKKSVTNESLKPEFVLSKNDGIRVSDIDYTGSSSIASRMEGEGWIIACHGSDTVHKETYAFDRRVDPDKSRFVTSDDQADCYILYKP